MRKAGMLRRRMKFDVSDIDSRSHRHSERLNRPIEVLVIERVLIVPHASTQVGYFVAHKPDPVVARSRLDLIYRRAICTSPSHDGRVLSYSRASRAKIEIRRSATHGMLSVRSVVKHVALSRMTLAPDTFIRDDVIGFGKIGSAGVLRRYQVAGLHENAVRSYVMTVVVWSSAVELDEDFH